MECILRIELRSPCKTWTRNLHVAHGDRWQQRRGHDTSDGLLMEKHMILPLFPS